MATARGGKAQGIPPITSSPYAALRKASKPVKLPLIPTRLCDDLRSAVARVDGPTLGRLGSNTASACDRLSSVVVDAVTLVSESICIVRSKVMRSRGLRDKALEAQLEELKAVVDTLEGCERLFRVASDSEYCIIVDWEDVEEGMCVAAQLLREMATPPCTSVLCTGRVESVISEVERMSRVQLGVDSDRSAVSHLRFLKRGEVNTVSIAPRDVVGDAMRGLSAEDVRAFLSDHTSSDTTGEGVSGVAVVDGSVVVSVSIEAETVHAVTLVACVDSARFELPLQVCLSFVLISALYIQLA